MDQKILENKKESDRILSKYPDRVPIIVNKEKISLLPDLKKNKYLVPKDMVISQFIFIIRKNLTLSSSEALFITINDKLCASNKKIVELYEEEKHEDGFLYIIYSSENTFG